MTTIRIALFALATAFAANLQASETHVRAGAQYWIFSMDGGSNDVGAALALGWNLGSAGSSALALEVSYASWDYQVAAATPLGVSREGDGRIVPIQLSYRYIHGLSDSLDLYAGAAAGVARISGTVQQSGSGLIHRGKISRTAFVGSIEAGVSGLLGMKWSWQAGYRFQLVDSSRVDSEVFAGSGGWSEGGPSLDTPSLDAHILSASLSYRF